MHRLRQVPEMKKAGYSINGISRALKMCTQTMVRLLDAPVSHDPSLETDSSALEAQTAPALTPQMPPWLNQLDWKFIVQERLKGVPFRTLYTECAGIPVTYWTFWKAASRLIELTVDLEPKTTIRINHNPGEKTFVDYADGIAIFDPATGEILK